MANLSNFPASVDTFTRKYSLNASDIDKMRRFQTLKAQTTLSSSEQTELTNLTNDLAYAFMNPDDFNKFTDSLTSMQNWLLTQTQTYINNLQTSSQSYFDGKKTEINTAQTSALTSIQTTKDSALASIEQKKDNIIEYMDSTTAGAIRNDIGVMGDLTTISKTSLVNALNEVNAKSSADASTTQKGIVQLNDNLNSTSISQAATANAVKKTNEDLTTHKSEKASLTKVGHVQLNSSTTSTDETMAATPKAVKSVSDRVTNLEVKTNANLLKNSTAAFGLNGWNNDTGSNFIQGSWMQGTYFLLRGATGATHAVLSAAPNPVNVDPGSTVTLSADFYTGGTNTFLYLELYGNGATAIIGNLMADLNKDWHRKSATFTIPADCTAIYVKFVSAPNSPNTDKCVSRIKIERGTFATPYSQEADFGFVSDGKNSIATAITGKGVSASGSDTFTQLATKIGQISPAKYATGNATSSSGGTNFTRTEGTTYTGASLQIASNFGFTPSKIILRRGATESVICDLSITDINYQIGLMYGKGNTNSLISVRNDGTLAYANSTGFRLPVWTASSSFTWEVFG